MGNAESQIGISSNFTAQEIDRLAKSFKKLDLDESGAISATEFVTAIPELASNPLMSRVISIFDTDGNGEINFQVAFMVYDMDNDGFISNGELYQTLKLMIGDNLKDEELQQIVDKSIIAADKDGDGKVSFQEFCDVVAGYDLQKAMNIDM